MDLSKYRKPALHFSGGKDSLACLYLLREQLPLLTVYWLNTGDVCPETHAVVDQIRPWIPNFVEINSDCKAWRAIHGDPSDIVPASGHQLGVGHGLSNFKVVNRFDCCWFNMMKPLHDRMMEDGVDAVIRGTKACDTGTVPAEGSTDCYDIILPIKDWSHQQVFDYLKEVGAPTNAIYDHFKSFSAPECVSCTAWWDDGKSTYLKEKHPQQHKEYVVKLQTIREALRSHLADLESEIGEPS